jgi:hypothetical protein
MHFILLFCDYAFISWVAKQNYGDMSYGLHHRDSDLLFGFQAITKSQPTFFSHTTIWNTGRALQTDLQMQAMKTTGDYFHLRNVPKNRRTDMQPTSDSEFIIGTGFCSFCTAETSSAFISMASVSS